MNAPDYHQWIETNQQALGDELSWLQRVLDGRVSDQAAAIDPPAARAFTLDFLADRLQLSGFERAIILLCAGIELNSEISRLCSRAQGNKAVDYATFSLALAALPDAHWSALSPDAPLRYWHLVRVHDPVRLTTSRLTLDERLLHFLLGAGSLDQRLAALVRTLVPTGTLATSQQAQIERLATLWAHDPESTLVQVAGNDAAAGREVAARACSQLGSKLVLLRAEDIPAAADERALLARLLTREHLLSRLAVIIDAADERPACLTAFIEQLACPVLLRGERPRDLRRCCAVIEINKPSAAEQRRLWHDALDGHIAVDDEALLSLAAQFDFSPADIGSAATSVQSELDLGTPLQQALWQTCRTQSRGGLDHLARRITPRADWDDLILPAGHKAMLRNISRQVRHRATVYETWRFAAKSDRGLGISALFAGESGTGKTMAAEVLARDLDLDLYRIDLSSVVSKYIGETEKNLERLFRAAESSGAILLFDEADALFGKRSDVKDSHDRYANIELAYLLQRMEAYRGLSILTSNMKSALDTAFMRRIRFVVQFPFPDTAHRREIWRHIFPDALPRGELDTEQLARLNVTGGNIRNIAMNAAFLAAEHHKPLCMADLAHATRMEYAKLEMPVNETELEKWA